MSEPGSTQRRPWWKLHFSTKVVIATFVLGLILANVPGQEVMHVDVPDQGKYGPHYGPYHRYEHGWPVSYLTRAYPNLWNSSQKSRLANTCWGMTQNVQSLSMATLGVDIFVGICLVIGAATLFEAWRRRRQSLWRFRLIELFGLVTIVAIAGGWYHWQSRNALQESDALREARRVFEQQAPNGFTLNSEFQRGGPTFLRELIGNRPFAFLDRVVIAPVVDSNLKLAHRLLHLKCIEASNGIDHEEAASISQLRELETIDACFSSLGALSEFPPMVSLRGVNLWDGGVTPRDLKWLGQCTNLEQLEMSNVNIGDEGLRHLVGLKKLKSFSAGGGYGEREFTDGCFELLAQFDGLEELWLSGEFRGDGVEALLPLKRLRDLNLDSPNFSPENLKRLEKFGHLKGLAIRGNGISDADIARLQATLPNCEVDGPRH